MTTGNTIYPSRLEAIDHVLSELISRCPAKFALLTDTSGAIIASHSEQPGLDLVPLAALVAADLVASQEIARLTGVYQNGQLIVREGEKVNAFIAEAGPNLILFLTVSHEVPLGWARLLIRTASGQLGEIAAVADENVERPDFGLQDINLADLAGDALISIWED